MKQGGLVFRFLGIRKSFYWVLFLALALSFAYLSSKPQKAYALGSVTLTASGFSDSDSEDTHKASQWVVRNSATTVYDSGADTANLLSITIPAATFTEGTTYWWKVRYQDNHDVWSDYSDEASFTYGGSSPTATPTSTSTSTSTAAPTATATITPPAYNPDAVFAVPDNVCLGSTASFSYMVDYYDLLKYRYGEVKKNLFHDIYLTLDGGKNFTRVVSDFDYTGATWVDVPGKSIKYLKINFTLPVPSNDGSYLTSQAAVLVHIYQYSSDSWGNKFTKAEGWKGGRWEDANAWNNFAFMSGLFKISDCGNQVPTATSTPSQCLNTIISPKKGDIWKVGNTYQVLWLNSKQASGDVKKVNIYLSKNNGGSFDNLLAVSVENQGVAQIKAVQAYATPRAMLKINGFADSGEMISSCLSDSFEIRGEEGFGGGGGTGGSGIGGASKAGTIANTLLVLGSLFAALATYLLTLAATIPMIANILSRISYPFARGTYPEITADTPAFERIFARVSHLFAPPVWPREKPAWGVVYDTVSKKPLSRVVLRIFSEPDSRLRQTISSNEKGEFGFLVPSGRYSITASHLGFNFPTHIVLSSSDGRFANVYRGGEVGINASGPQDKAPININIPMDPTRLNVIDISAVSMIRTIQRLFATIRLPIMAIGTLAAIYLVIERGLWFDWFILAIYIVLWALEVKYLFKKRTYGVVTGDDGEPLGLAMIRVLDTTGRIKSTVVTGDDGKFVLNLNPGLYRFDASKPGYASSRSKLLRISRASDLGNVTLRLTKLSRSVGGLTQAQKERI
jgi:hypothetical protein